MSTQNQPVTADPTTGEVIDIASINAELVRLNRQLAEMEPSVRALLEELRRVSLRYDVEYSTAVLASPQRSEDRRRADATLHVSQVVLDDSPEPLASRKSRLEIQLRAMRDAGHDIRARMSALQTISNNLRTQARVEGYMP